MVLGPSLPTTVAISLERNIVRATFDIAEEKKTCSDINLERNSSLTVNVMKDVRSKVAQKQNQTPGLRNTRTQFRLSSICTTSDLLKHKKIVLESLHHR